ncbi:hypothetical protein L596_028005 [Steinernema carpocapsae]|uniref:Uncharacterized protein n=1 Tax=Steinernema carpocapsae TaxID=34508 RepID=A0A4U5LX62_STECR|nr:hypothetical protein L596_028005 [Steinernema carpocapsae]
MGRDWTGKTEDLRCKTENQEPPINKRRETPACLHNFSRPPIFPLSFHKSPNSTVLSRINNLRVVFKGGSECGDRTRLVCPPRFIPPSDLPTFVFFSSSRRSTKPVMKP